MRGSGHGVEEQIGRVGKRQVYHDALINELRLEEHVMHEVVATGYPVPEDAPVGACACHSSAAVPRGSAGRGSMRG